MIKKSVWILATMLISSSAAAKEQMSFLHSRVVKFLAAVFKPAESVPAKTNLLPDFLCR